MCTERIMGRKRLHREKGFRDLRGSLWSIHLGIDQHMHTRKAPEAGNTHTKELEGTILKALKGPGRVHVPTSQTGNLLTHGASGRVLRKVLPL